MATHAEPGSKLPDAHASRKTRLKSWDSMSLVSNTKLIRTDNILFLSQKAEKHIGMTMSDLPKYTRLLHRLQATNMALRKTWTC